jgi:hypothetical protein
MARQAAMLSQPPNNEIRRPRGADNSKPKRRAHSAAVRPTEVRILSVRQPWAHLIVAGLKRVENRSWSTRWRGPVLIHAALRPGETPVQQIERKFRITIPRDLPRGGIVGMAGLADVITASNDPFFEGQCGFIMLNARQLPFMPIAGGLGLRIAPAALVEAVKPHLVAKVAAAVEAYRAKAQRPL